MTQYVSVPKLLKALKTLKDLGNPYYQFVPDIIDFKQKLLVSDIEGFNFLYPEESLEREKDNSHENIEFACEESEADCEGVADAEDDNVTEDIEEIEYMTKDSIKKFQFDYNKSTCFSDDYPEINFREDNAVNVSIAPGEGKTPTNNLEEKDWDLKTFPTLHPDGKNSLH